MKVSYERLREATDVALKELRLQGVQGLPEAPEEDASKSFWWAHPLIWLVIGMLSVSSGLLLLKEPPISPVRFEGDFFPFGGMTEGDLVLFFIFIPSFMGIVFFGYVLNSLFSSGFALQFIGTILRGLPWLGRALIRIARLAGNSWKDVRVRFCLQICLLLFVQLSLHGLIYFRIYNTYRAVSLEGLREVWPGRHKIYPWNDLVEIQVYCSQDKTGGHFRYKMLFEGVEFDLLRMDKKGIPILNGIDQALLAEGVPKRKYTEEGAKFCASLWPNEEERPLIEEIFKR